MSIEENQEVSEEKIKELLQKANSPIQVEDMGEGRVKVDFDTPFESFFTILIALGFFANLIILVMLIFGDIEWDYACEQKEYYFIPLVVIILSFISRSYTDNFYILDLMKQEIHFSRKIFFYKSEHFVAPFHEIYCVTLQGKRERSKYDKWWEYYGVIILSSGRMIRISDPFKIENSHYPEEFKQIAKHLGTQFLSPVEKTKLKVVLTPVQSIGSFKRIPESDLDREYLYKTIFYILAGVVIFFLAVALLNPF